jgi:DNA primase small subunit
MTPEQAQDEMIVEPQAENAATQASENTAVADETENGDTPGEDATEQDMTMEDVGVQGEKVSENVVKEEIKPEVKLEDLFADVESDEEFPSSTALDIKTSSSPDAPSSPV